MARKRQRKSVVPAPPSGEAISRIVEHLPGVMPVQQRVKQVITQQSHFQGPIPHPDIFRQYGEVIPDAPERILRVFEDDSKHAREIQMAALDAQKADNSRVHWMAWSLIAGGYILSGLFAWLGKDTLAGILLASTLTGTIAGFFQGRPSQKKPSSDQQG